MSGRYRNILVGYDGSDWSKKALEAAVALATEEPKSKINVISVLPPIIPYRPAISSYAEVEEEREAEATKTLNEVRGSIEEAGLDNAVELVEGDPAQQLIRYADRNDCDLIVVGSRGLSGIREFYLGSTSHHIAQRAKCPVLIVK